MKIKDVSHSFGSYRATIIACMAAVIFLVVMTSSSDDTYSDSLNPGVYSRDSAPFGIPYEDWPANWWSYNVKFSAEEHPRDNFSPERCNLDQEQSDPVYYLPDNLSGEEERRCTVPVGKAILGPQITGSCWDDDTDPKLKTEAGLRECSREGQEFGVVRATLDGRELQGLEQYRVTSDVFNMTIPENNAFQSPPGTFPAIADGFFVFLEPLPVGEHTLQLQQSNIDPVKPELNFASKTAYILTVQ
jgi:hypothetical protein